MVVDLSFCRLSSFKLQPWTVRTDGRTDGRTDEWNAIRVYRTGRITTLFKTYCLCLYGTALWKNFSATVYRKLKSAYNKCIKKMFGYIRRDSMTSVFFDLSLPTLDTVVHNSRMLFANQSLRSCNKIVQWFLTIRVY